MNKKEGEYWYEELDRFGLFFGGIFIGAMAETGIRTLGIIVGVAGLTCVAILICVIKRCVLDGREVKE